MRIIEPAIDYESDTEVPSCFGCIRARKRFKMPKQTPEKETPIEIWFNDIKEEFKASLVTYNRYEKNGDILYRHFLVNVSETGPADLMKIKECDELLELNEEGVPNRDHDDAIKLFNNIKIDGQTRFCMLLRRRPERKWIWCKTSAVLLPETTPVQDPQPSVENAEFKKLDKDYDETETNNRYKIRGTQRYLGIRDQQVMTSVLTDCHGDSSDANMMCKIQRIWQDGEGRVYYQAALSDAKRQNYIGVDADRKIIVKSKPEWFDIKEMASEIEFTVNGLYLGYNEQDDQVDAQTSNFRFEEIPGEVPVTLLVNHDNRNVPHDKLKFGI